VRVAAQHQALQQHRQPAVQQQACVGRRGRVRACVLCCAVLCCAVLCCAVLCCAVLCCAVLCWLSLSLQAQVLTSTL
jgi:hypothetical protein